MKRWLPIVISFVLGSLVLVPLSAQNPVSIFLNGAPPSDTNALAVKPISLPALTTGSAVIGAVTQSGTWTVTGAGGTFPSTQSGTWTVQPGNTQNTTPWLIAWSGSQFVTPISLPALTTGSATIGALVANQSVNVNQWNGASVASPDANNYPITAHAASATSTLAASSCVILSGAYVSATNCKASSGNFYGYEIYNTTTTVYYLRLYNLTTVPVASSSSGFIRSIPIPPASTAGQVGGAVSNFVVPVNFATGIGFVITGGSSSTDSTVGAAGIFGEVRYK